jgi:hypothetical protein
MLTSTLIATLAPMLTLLPVLAIVFRPRRARAPLVIRIDGRHYRNAPGTIEHEVTRIRYQTPSWREIRCGNDRYPTRKSRRNTNGQQENTQSCG